MRSFMRLIGTLAGTVQVTRGPTGRDIGADSLVRARAGLDDLARADVDGANAGADIDYGRLCRGMGKTY